MQSTFVPNVSKVIYVFIITTRKGGVLNVILVTLQYGSVMVPLESEKLRIRKSAKSVVHGQLVLPTQKILRSQMVKVHTLVVFSVTNSSDN